MRRLAAYYVTLLGAVILTNVAVYFVGTRLLGLPSSPSFRFLAVCTLLILVVTAPAVLRRIRAERFASAQGRVSPPGADSKQSALATGIIGFAACTVLVVAAVYLLATNKPIPGAVSAIVAAVVAAITSRRFRRSITRRERNRDAGEGTASP